MRCLLPVLAAFLLLVTARAEPVDHSVTYQGELTDAGLPAAGDYDLRFRLFDAATAGGQLGPALSVDGLRISDGRFTVVLDFGDQFGPDSRWLEIAVRRQGGSFTTVSPRQKIHAAPIALFALATPAQPHGVAEFLASTSWTVPAGVSSITVELWGAGGGGESGSWPGGSGAYAKVPLQTLPGEILDLVVPPMGGVGSDGGDAVFFRRTDQGQLEIARAGGGHRSIGGERGLGGAASGPAGSLLLAGFKASDDIFSLGPPAPFPSRFFEFRRDGINTSSFIQAGGGSTTAGRPGYILISW